MRKVMRTLILGSLTILTVLAVSGAWSVDSASAFFCGCSETSCYNRLGQPVAIHTAGPVTGTSTADCHWAHMEANQQLNAGVSCPLGFCSYYYTNVNPTGSGEPCNYNAATGLWSVEKKLTWSCLTCVGFFTPCF